MVLPCFASFLRAWMIAESSLGGRPTASRPWRSKVVIWRSRSPSASALVLKNFRPRLKGRRSRYQGCVLLWRYSRTLRVGRFMAANMRKEADNVNAKSTIGFGAELRRAFVIGKRL